ncbi:predicted protein [Nematostella vectensis]|uniref:WD repeat and HMG-box DNA-binding protein 1 n=1 Tax=Nematostella vectensis TaxID=45351 RepID=A7RQ41_NEMVE|nr:predicted protein [Nematostella vectensis]|eukprot:XP_001638557.1 predicted protein [Nematostella vectensis]
MNLAQRLNDLAFQKAQEEAEEVYDDDEQLNWPPRRAQNTVSSARRGSSRQREVDNDEDQMEVAHEDSDDERDMTGRRRAPKSNSKARKSKQMTLQSKVGNQIKADRPDEKADRQTKKKNGFSLWLEENRDQIEEENPDIPDEDVVKIAMKTWKGLDSVEKKVWNEKAKGNAGETEEKKRKRENDENDAEYS